MNDRLGGPGSDDSGWLILALVLAAVLSGVGLAIVFAAPAPLREYVPDGPDALGVAAGLGAASSAWLAVWTIQRWFASLGHGRRGGPRS
jgi:hypothetical protein